MKDLLSFNSAAPPSGGFLWPRKWLFCCLKTQTQTFRSIRTKKNFRK
uniref:Uncharacterized protein n=1 Tax=Siphoviridae sp. ctRg81 TaxID=2826336 RepID=A0A8S5NID0_9CAUD|nr:MAG TPA: hypothetical protein [Siphoviridae sp. ctRg81]